MDYLFPHMGTHLKLMSNRWIILPAVQHIVSMRFKVALSEVKALTCTNKVMNSWAKYFKWFSSPLMLIGSC